MKHVILGAGPIGSGTAKRLVEAGHEVVVVTRSGSGPDGATKVQADVADRVRLTEIAAGASTILNALNPPYAKWAEVWPTLHGSIMRAAEATGAGYVLMDNLYGYGRVDGPMREGDAMRATGKKGKVRVAMSDELLSSSRVRGAVLRASDFWGPTVTDAAMGERVVPRVLTGKSVSVLGDPDAPHSWSYMPDVTRALATLVERPELWGRDWHAPTAPAVGSRQLVAALASAAGVDAPKVKTVAGWMLKVGGVAVPLLRELQETAHQFERPFVMDSSAFTEATGQQPTPLAAAAAETVAWWRARTTNPAAARSR
jgi:nucleoside-diphosphate-sugar epimerase